jgi:glutamine cyclotransferase
LDNKITQLTWQSGLAFVYRADNLDPVGTITFSGEGWGLTASDSGFISTDGSDKVFFRDHDFRVVRVLQVKMNGVGVRWLNDLVIVDGSLYLNRLGDPRIFVASARSGVVSRIIDCSSLVALAKPTGPEDFLNGITYIPGRQQFVVTGKRWDRFFFLKL